MFSIITTNDDRSAKEIKCNSSIMFICLNIYRDDKQNSQVSISKRKDENNGNERRIRILSLFRKKSLVCSASPVE